MSPSHDEDRRREAYDRWGLTRARRRDIWLDPNVYRTYWQLLRAGDKLRPGGSDLLQLGGDFVVDPHGKLAYSRPQRRDDRPTTGELLRAAALAETEEQDPAETEEQDPADLGEADDPPPERDDLGAPETVDAVKSRRLRRPKSPPTPWSCRPAGSSPATATP